MKASDVYLYVAGQELVYLNCTDITLNEWGFLRFIKQNGDKLETNLPYVVMTHDADA